MWERIDLISFIPVYSDYVKLNPKSVRNNEIVCVRYGDLNYVGKAEVGKRHTIIHNKENSLDTVIARKDAPEILGVVTEYYQKFSRKLLTSFANRNKDMILSE